MEKYGEIMGTSMEKYGEIMEHMGKSMEKYGETCRKLCGEIMRNHEVFGNGSGYLLCTVLYSTA